jgi:hypothetical protein
MLTIDDAWRGEPREHLKRERTHRDPAQADEDLTNA